MKIKFYAHACFRLEGDGLTIITDPYTPGPEGAGFDPIDEPADIVIRSSDDDRFHNNPDHVTGNPIVVTATEIPPEGVTVKGLHLKAIPVMESLSYDFGRPRLDNAMYYFTLDGIRLLHMGDLGNPFTAEQLEPLIDKVEVLFALTGAHATIALDDLAAALEAIKPKIVIPMHYWHERGVLDIEPVTTFTGRFPPERVTWLNQTEMTVTAADLPEPFHVYVLKQAR